eukprot:gene970-4559_t
MHLVNTIPLFVSATKKASKAKKSAGKKKASKKKSGLA